MRAAWLDIGPSDQRITVSSIVLHELETGALLSDRPGLQRDRLHTFVDRCTVVEFGPGDAVEAAQVRSRLLRAGTPIGALDILIAGQAIARGWTLVTRNVKHFGRIGGLPIIDWSVGTEPLDPAEIARRVAAP